MDIGILQISDPESAHMFVLIPVYDVKTKKLQIFYVLDKTWAADLYLIYKLEPKARVCISDTDRMRMF
jgi:hypothetical protein